MSKHAKVFIISLIIASLIYRDLVWQILVCTLLFFVAVEAYLSSVNFCKKKHANIKEDIFENLNKRKE